MKTSHCLHIYEVFLLSHSSMSQLKHCALLEGEVLTDLATGQRYMLQPSDEDLANGIWQFDPNEDGARWHYIILNGLTYAINWAYIDWDQEVEEWNCQEMGQWPFGNTLNEEEQLLREVDDVLFSLECYLENEIEWMDKIEDQENGLYDDDDDDYSDVDSTTEDEGYDTSPEVDFDQYDFWVFQLNPILMRIKLYRGDEDEWWTL